MCGNCNDPFHGLDDDLDDLMGDTPPWSTEDKPFEVKGTLDQAPIRATHETRAAAAGHRYTERCDAKGCSNGTFVSYSGRAVGPCFKCKGKGVLTFKTSPEARAKARNANERKAEQKAQSLRENAQLWRETNRADWNWISDNRESFDFAESMAQSLQEYGALTDKQHAAVVRLREKAEARKAEARQRAENAPVVNTALLEQAFANAQANGIKKPKLRLDAFKFSLAPAHGANAGAIYVTDAAADAYLGKIKDGKFMRVRDCSAEQEARVIAVMADPKAAAIAYGRRTGNCCICGRELTNAESIELGIGPICAGRMGW